MISLLLGAAMQAASVGPVSVMDFGARGDGSGDDAAAFQRAINAAAPQGRPILVPAGVFVIGSTLKWIQRGSSATRTDFPPLQLIGEGAHATRIASRTASSFLLDIDVAPPDPARNINFHRGLRIEGIGFYGTTNAQPSGRQTPGASGIRLARAYQAEISRCEFIGFEGTGLKIPSQYGDADGPNIVVLESCRFQNCETWGLDAKADDGRNEISYLTLRSCRFDSCGRPQRLPGVPTTGGLRFKGQAGYFLQTVWYGCQGAGLLVDTDASGLADRVVLEDCDFENNTYAQYIRGVRAMRMVRGSLRRSIAAPPGETLESVVMIDTLTGFSRPVVQLSYEGVNFQITSAVQPPIKLFKARGTGGGTFIFRDPFLLDNLTAPGSGAPLVSTGSGALQAIDSANTTSFIDESVGACFQRNFILGFEGKVNDNALIQTLNNTDRIPLNPMYARRVRSRLSSGSGAVLIEHPAAAWAGATPQKRGTRIQLTLENASRAARPLAFTPSLFLGSPGMPLPVSIVAGEEVVMEFEADYSARFKLVSCSQLPVRTSAQMRNAADPVNTGAHKTQGSMIFNSDLNMPLYASGSRPESGWHTATGALAIQPVRR